MRTEQPTKCFVPLQKLRASLAPKRCLSHPPPPPQYFITERSEAEVLLWFSVACFGVRVSVTFHFTRMCVHIILVPFRLLSGHPLENSCSLG